MKKIIIGLLSLSTLVLTLDSCRESALEPTLAQSKDITTAITSVGDLTALMNGAYSRMTAAAYYGRDYIIYGEVRSDNAFANGNTNRFTAPAAFNMNADDGYANDTWTQIYRVIANTNIVISKENAGITGDAAMLNQLLGEAYAMRALAHFDLLKLYGQYNVGTGGMTALGVPYVTTFAEPEYIYPSRNTVQEVYDFAISDLDKAISLLNQNRGNAYITQAAAYAIKARIALYYKQYATAKTAAEQVVNMGAYSIASSDSFETVFSNEMAAASNVIFGLECTATDNPSIDGLANIYRGNSYGDIKILANLYNVYDASDVRRSSTMISSIGLLGGVYQNDGKYPNHTTYSDDIPLIRYEEVVLMYAEALLETGDAATALTWLNKVPAERSATAYTSATLDNILLERRKELAFEGFRAFDLLRTQSSVEKVDTRQTFSATIANGSTDLAFPIPNAETGANSNVVQNAGY